MARNTQPKRQEEAEHRSDLERDLTNLIEEQKNEVSVILSLLERMTTQEHRARFYVTSYPACMTATAAQPCRL